MHQAEILALAPSPGRPQVLLPGSRSLGGAPRLSQPRLEGTGVGLKSPDPTLRSSGAVETLGMLSKGLGYREWLGSLAHLQLPEP